jgi:hypothetical protein
MLNVMPSPATLAPRSFVERLNDANNDLGCHFDASLPRTIAPELAIECLNHSFQAAKQFTC